MRKLAPTSPTVESPLGQEADLVRAAAEGDQDAVKEVVQQHLGAITRFASRMLSDTAEAEDVAQETFYRLWRELPRWEARAKLSTWLHRIAHNLCIDRLRNARNVTLGDTPDREDPHGEASTQMEQFERSQAIQRGLAELPERQRAAITLVYHQGLSNQEAAYVLGTQVDALESLLVRGRQSLRKRLLETALDHQNPKLQAEPL